MEAACRGFPRVMCSYIHGDISACSSHFWSCVALQGRTGQSVDKEHHSVSLDCGKENCDDQAEREAIRRHAGWAIKHARDVINSGSTIVFIKQSKDDKSPAIQVTKRCLLSFFENFGMDQHQDSGKYLFILNDATLEFFIVLHKDVETFIGTGMDKDIVVRCLQYLSCNQHIRTEWKKIVGVLSGENQAASIIILQRLVSMFLKSKQQIIREQLHLKPQKQSKSLRQ